MHSHSPFQNLNGNLIVGNQISKNGPDGDVPTSGPTESWSSATPPVVRRRYRNGHLANIISDEEIGIAAATNGAVDAHRNPLLDKHDVGLANLAAARSMRNKTGGAAKKARPTTNAPRLSGPMSRSIRG